MQPLNRLLTHIWRQASAASAESLAVAGLQRSRNERWRHIRAKAGGGIWYALHLLKSAAEPPIPEYRSRTSTHGRNMAGARALWRATGMQDDDFQKPIIAIANSFTQFVPGHVHLKDMGQLVAGEIQRCGGVAKKFNTIAVDDGKNRIRSFVAGRDSRVTEPRPGIRPFPSGDPVSSGSPPVLQCRR